MQHANFVRWEFRKFSGHVITLNTYSLHHHHHYYQGNSKKKKIFQITLDVELIAGELITNSLISNRFLTAPLDMVDNVKKKMQNF